MKEDLHDVEPMVYKSKISVPYHWWAGDTASSFFIALRDEKKIMGTRCGNCRKVFLPPRKVCPECFTENEEWIEVSHQGTVQSFTVARRQLASLSKKVPVIFGLIKLDGADTAILHYIEECDPDNISIGMRVEAQFSENRIGNINDILSFKPV